MITIGSRAADTPERRTAEAVNNDKRGVDLPIILASDVKMWAEATSDNWNDSQKFMVGGSECNGRDCQESRPSSGWRRGDSADSWMNTLVAAHLNTMGRLGAGNMSLGGAYGKNPGLVVCLGIFGVG